VRVLPAARGTLAADRHRRRQCVSYAIETEGLAKRFGNTIALDGVDFAARHGAVLGLLGPNGAGKTTAVRILATLVKPTPAGRPCTATTWWPRPPRFAG
jgi:ABC-type polysaccharide/polyol phosphate transport system ATPase subunit